MRESSARLRPRVSDFELRVCNVETGPACFARFSFCKPYVALMRNAARAVFYLSRPVLFHPLPLILNPPTAPGAGGVEYWGGA